jgi:hypothetical protein
MRQKLLQKAGLLSLVVLATGIFLSGCIEEPNPPVLDRVTSEVRFVHAVPDAPAVDIWVDGEKVLPSAGYKASSDYRKVNSGNRFLRVVPAGADTNQAVFRRLVSVRSLTKMTMAFYNTVDDVSLLITQERFTYADETSILVDSCDVKLINLSGTGEAFALSNLNDDVLIPAVNATSLSAYKRLLAGNTDFAITRQNGSRAVEFNFNLQKPGYRYSFVVVGNSGGLEVLTLQDEPKN